MDSGPFIVVSDVHFGSYECNAEEFSHFCDWLEALERTGSPKVVIDEHDEQNGRWIHTPQTVILLGDFLELWDARRGDHTAAFRDCFTVLDKLFSLTCKKVYVLGNHDEELTDYDSITEKRNAEGSAAFVPQDYVCKNGSLFLVVNGHYPNYEPKDQKAHYDTKKRKEIARKEWKQAGDTKYIFLHGHQFDKMFEHVGPLRRVPGLMARVASFFGNKLGPLCFVVFLALVAVYWTGVLSPLSGPLTLVWLIFIVLSAIVGIPWVWVKLQKSAWKHFFKRFAKSPKYEDIGAVVDKNYYKSDRDCTDKKSVIVFGHTHVPDLAIAPKRPNKRFRKKSCSDSRTKTFINCGAWVRPEQQEPRNKATQNTLVYIDEKGPLLLQWDDCKREVLYYLPATRGDYSVLTTKP
jgi:UDP-2,3-diacylglucosamine pyrophosphatase LpxH